VLEELIDGVAKQETLERVQTTIGGLATASALSTLSSAESTHNTTTQGKLNTLQTTANTLATASALSTLQTTANTLATASALSTLSSAEGTHNTTTQGKLDTLQTRLTALEDTATGIARANMLDSLAVTMATAAATAEAECMLEWNGVPEPFRDRIKRLMTAQQSMLRPKTLQLSRSVMWIAYGEHVADIPSSYVIFAVKPTIMHPEQIIIISPEGTARSWCVRYGNMVELNLAEDAIQICKASLTNTQRPEQAVLVQIGIARLAGTWAPPVISQTSAVVTIHGDEENVGKTATIAKGIEALSSAVVITKTQTDGEGNETHIVVNEPWHYIMGYRI
jgi:hypothetical protein